MNNVDTSQMPTVDQLENRRDLKMQGEQKMSRKALCIMIAVFLVLAAITFGVLFTIDKKA